MDNAIRDMFKKIKVCLCVTVCFTNLFFVTLLTLVSTYCYVVFYDNSNEVQLCTNNKLHVESDALSSVKSRMSNGEVSTMQCCSGEGNAYKLCKIVENTTQATIILMLVVVAFLSLEVYCDKCSSKRDNEDDDER